MDINIYKNFIRYNICICLFILFHEIIRTAKNRLIKVPIIIDHSKYCQIIEIVLIIHTYFCMYSYINIYLHLSI